MNAMSSSPQVRTEDGSREFWWFGVLLLLLAATLLMNSAIGPLGANMVRYPISDSLANQLIGLEVVTVALVVPWCVLAGVRALQGSPDGAVLAFGPAAYTCYMFVQYVLGPEYGEYRAVLLLHLALVTLSCGLTLWSWALLTRVELPARSRRVERVYGGVLLGLALFVIMRYAAAITGSFTGTEIPQEFGAARTFYWTIYLLDLGVVVPGTVVAAVALLRGRDLGRRALFAVVGWFALVPPSVTAMAVIMFVNEDPHASMPTVVLLSIASLVFGVFAVVVYRPIFLASPSWRPDHRGDQVVEVSAFGPRRQGVPAPHRREPRRSSG